MLVDFFESNSQNLAQLKYCIDCYKIFSYLYSDRLQLLSEICSVNVALNSLMLSYNNCYLYNITNKIDINFVMYFLNFHYVKYDLKCLSSFISTACGTTFARLWFLLGV